MKHVALRARPWRATKKAYTLVELLVVISIIAVLSSLAFSVTRAVILKGQILETRTLLTNIQTAVQQYFTEYHRMPVEDGSEEPVRLNQGSPVVAILLGDQAGPGRANPAGIPFLQANPARNGRHGLIENAGAPPSLVDRWGNPLYLLMDSDRDGRVPNPDRANRDPGIAADAPPHLRTRVAVFSAGPDGERGTRDDIVSWR